MEKEKKFEDQCISLDAIAQVWCMIKINIITYIENGEKINLNLLAVGFSNGRIYLIDLSIMKSHQIIKESNTVYSLCQFNNDTKYLICSISTGFISIYRLNNTIYEIIQKIQKPSNLRKGAINKVITLSNGDLASGDNGSISIWKQAKDEKEANFIDEFKFFKEIITNNDTCHLIEVNQNIFACAIYKEKLIKVFNNNEDDYPLLGKISNVESHGENSNGMAKINDKIFCLGGKNYFIYVICVEPVQLIQKIKLVNENSLCKITCLHMSNNGYLFAAYVENIAQFKIIKDDKNNFVEFKKIDTITNKDRGSKAITSTGDGAIFYEINKNINTFCLHKFKTN